MKVGELVAYLTLDDSQFNAKLDKSHQKLGEVGKTMSSVGGKMSVGLTLPLVGIGAVAMKTAADFETSMNMVQAATQAPASEMKGLSDLALKMGADTVFSSGEAADAMLELAKTGFSPAQIEAGALKATMDLAAAGGLELADSATAVGNAMNTFSLKAQDAAQIAAAFAGGANASSADVSDLTQALQQVGPGAKNAGLSLQQTVGVLAEFADKGIRGSDAGTSLKTMLMNLVPSTAKAETTMKSLGITFTNADGSFKSISEIAQILQDKMGGLSQEQRTLAMNIIFGSDATRAATVLMEGGSQAVDKYTKATSDQAAATDMAKARMKGLGGALENAKGSVESLGITMGEVAAPAIEKVAGGVQWLANALAGLPGWAQKAAVGFGVILAAAGPLLVIVGKLLTSLQAVRNFQWKRSLPTGAGGAVPSSVGQTQAGAGEAPAAGNVVRLGTASGVAASEVAMLGRAAAGAGGIGGTAGKVAGLGSASSNATRSFTRLKPELDGVIQPVGTLKVNAQQAGTKLGNLGAKVQNSVIPSVGGFGTVAGTARGKLGKFDAAMGNSTVGAIGQSLALSAALSFTIPKVIEAGGAFMQWMDALKTLDYNRNSRVEAAKDYRANIVDQYGSVSAYFDHLAQKFGKDSPQYKNAVEALGQNKSGNLSGRYAGAIPQAAGGDYLVSRPTLFLAGEAGPERATFTPQGKSGGARELHLHVHVEGGTFIGTDLRRAGDELAEATYPRIRQKIAEQAASGF